MDSADSPDRDEHPFHPGSRILTLFTVFIGYAVLAVAITWPLAKQFFTDIPQGTESVETVPLFNAWTIWWNCDRLGHGFESYWTAPIFAPLEGTFTFSEMQPVTLLVAPVWHSSRNLALAYNVYLTLSLWLNAVFGFWFCRRIGFTVPVALAGGALVMSLPFVQWQFGVLQLIPIWPALWLCVELSAFADPDRSASRWRLGLAFAVSYLTCHHYGLFLAVLLPVCGIVLIRWELLRTKRFWLTLCSNAILAGVLLAPFVHAQLHYLGNIKSERKLKTVTRLSAHLGDYTSSNPGSWFAGYHLADPKRAEHWPLSPGYIIWGLSVVGLLGGLIGRGQRRVILFLGLLLLLSLLLSLGPRFQPGGIALYERFIVRLPGFAQVRNIFRFAVFAQLAAVLLAACGLHCLGRCALRLINRRYWVACGLLVLAGVSMAETWPRPQELCAVPELDRHAGWTTWLRTKTDSQALVATVPFSRGGSTGSYVITTRGMILGTAHQRRLVNGYSGYFPQSYRDLRGDAAMFPGGFSIEALEAANVRYVIDMRRSELVPEDYEWSGVLPAGIQLVFFDSQAKVAIYELKLSQGESD